MWENKEECFANFDDDKDRKLNLKEFSELTKALFQNEDSVPYTVEEADVKNVFEIFDKDSDRFIDRDEFDFVWDKWITVILKPVCSLIIVDVQNDFITGTLAIDNCKDTPEEGNVVPPINQLLDKIPFDMVCYSYDWHPENHISFIDNVHRRKVHSISPVSAEDAKVFDTVIFEGPPIMKQKLWPKHAVQNTWGSELHPDLKVLEGAIKVYKGTNSEVDSYSAFWDNLKVDETELRIELKKRNVTDVFICGLAYDYCAGGTALDAMKAGFRAIMVDDCTAGITFEIMDEMKAAIISKRGIIVDSDKVLAMVEGRDRRPELGIKLAHDLKQQYSH